MLKKILLGFLGLIVLVVALVLFATSGMTDTAEEFFADVSKGDYDKAYTMLSEDFKRSVSKEQLKSFMDSNGLSDYKSASWGNRSFEGKRGVLEGSIETRSGSAVALKIDFVKTENGDWKIYHISKPAAGVSTESDKSSKESAKKADLVTPSKDEIKKMVKKTIHDFAVSINEKSMKPLYETMSSAFKEQYALEKFNGIYKKFFEMNNDFTLLDKMEPTIESPIERNDDGTIVVNGYYPTKPSRFIFKLRYIRESGEWKPIGIYTTLKEMRQNTRQKSQAPVQAKESIVKEEYLRLVKNTMHTFAVCVNEKSMQKLYSDLADMAQKQTSVEKLNEAFKAYLNSNVNLLLLDKIDPVFDQKPSVSSDGILWLKGHYNTADKARLHYDLRYIKEGSDWKLAAMNLVVK